MSDTRNFIAKLGALHVKLSARGSQLQYDGAASALSAEVLGEIERRKSELIEFFQQANRAPVIPLGPRAVNGRYPLAFGQEAFINSYERMTELSTQHSLICRRLGGPLDCLALGAAFRALMQRHGALRTRYVTAPDGALAMMVDAPVPDIPLWDLRAMEEAARESQARHLIVAAIGPRFDLRTGPLIRPLLICISTHEHIFALVVHHSISDAFSMHVMLRDLGALYDACVNDTPAQLPELAFQFADYATCIREWMASPDGQQHLAYWHQRLATVRKPFWLPTDSEAAGNKGEPQVHRIELKEQTLEKLRELARSHKTTTPAVLLAAYATALSRWSESPSVLVALTHFGRSLSKLMNLIGCFVQAWPLHVAIHPNNGFGDVVEQIARSMDEAQLHIQVPLTAIKPELSRLTDESPLRLIMFNYARLPRGYMETSFGPLRVTPFVVPKPDTLDEGRAEKLNLTSVEYDDRIEIWFRYARSLFADRTISRFVASFHSLLMAAAGDEPTEKA